MNLEAIDIIAYLEDKNIPFRTEGKNVTIGWTNINCPWCSDPSHHLGISPSNLYHCWRCGAKGSVINIIMEVEKSSYKSAQLIAEEYSDYSISEQAPEKPYLSRCSLPPEATELQSIHKEFLGNRQFNPNFLTEKYHLKACYLTGDYKYRIIVPVILNKKIVNFVGIDITGQANQKYKNCKNETSVIPMKHLLYNIDSVLDTALIVEGVTDVWRLGDGTVAVMGMEYTQEQILLLHQRKIRKAVVMFDSELLAIKKANKLANALSVVIPIVEVIELELGDPADLPEEEVLELREKIFEF